MDLSIPGNPQHAINAPILPSEPDPHPPAGHYLPVHESVEIALGAELRMARDHIAVYLDIQDETRAQSGPRRGPGSLQTTPAEDSSVPAPDTQYYGSTLSTNTIPTANHLPWRFRHASDALKMDLGRLRSILIRIERDSSTVAKTSGYNIITVLPLLRGLAISLLTLKLKYILLRTVHTLSSPWVWLLTYYHRRQVVRLLVKVGAESVEREDGEELEGWGWGVLEWMVGIFCG